MAFYRSRIERALDHWLPAATTPPRTLHEAMRYATLAGGKYVRPLLVYTTGRTLGVTPEALDGPACAVELIHAYSLVHDDLPAMDDDDLRRGKPTCHKVYGEAMAILTGDALQSLAFHILAHDPALRISPERRLRMIDTLAIASSSQGMAGGQAIDLEAVGKELDLQELENMHLRKTGALIRASVILGALAHPTAGEDLLRLLGTYARCIGLAFQIRDDILDVEGDTTVLGKTRGADQVRNKPTYPALLGVEGARRKAAELYEKALAQLTPLGRDADPLRWLTRYIVQRER